MLGLDLLQKTGLDHAESGLAKVQTKEQGLKLFFAPATTSNTLTLYSVILFIRKIHCL
jgi:hypothetical protein